MSDWQHGLCGCFDNCGMCIITYFLPCYTAGKNAEAVGQSCCLFGCLSMLGPIGMCTRASTRGKIRESRHIDGGFIGDCCMHMFCPFCALVQEGQEVQGGAMAASQGQSMARE